MPSLPQPGTGPNFLFRVNQCVHNHRGKAILQSARSTKGQITLTGATKQKERLGQMSAIDSIQNALRAVKHEMAFKLTDFLNQQAAPGAQYA